jgi:hypothetical protein
MGKSGAKIKGYLRNMDTGEMKSFMFNPEEFSDQQDINFYELDSPGGRYPVFSYNNTGAKKVSLDLFMYTRDSGIQGYLDFLDGFKPDPAYSLRFYSPPTILFVMGQYIVEGNLTSMKRDFKDFNTDLTYRHVEVSLEITEVN